MELTDYKVRILDEEGAGTSATTRVIITTSDKRGSWGTVGVSENIIEASWNALGRFHRVRPHTSRRVVK